MQFDQQGPEGFCFQLPGAGADPAHRREHHFAAGLVADPAHDLARRACHFDIQTDFADIGIGHGQRGIAPVVLLQERIGGELCRSQAAGGIAPIFMHRVRPSCHCLLRHCL